MNTQNIVDEARTWIGTPWQHQARLRGVGTDCVGLCIGVGWSLGLIEKDRDMTNYGREPDGSLLSVADTFASRVDTQQNGDVVVIAFEGRPMHFGILAETQEGFNLIHAYTRMRKVVEHGLDDGWKSKVVATYRFSGVTQ